MNPLISASALAESQREAAPLLVIDCSFDLTDPGAGERLHDGGHVPGAAYLHLDRDLSGPKTGRNGRHPLPTREAFAATMARLGASDQHRIVAYDHAGGMYAARLWWMLRWVGHGAAQVLDGGLAAWKAAGLPLTTERFVPPAAAGAFSLRPPLATVLDFDGVKASMGRPDRLVIDARSPDRFRGENETLDPVGGRIPGAANRFFRDNLAADGRFRPADELRREFLAVMGTVPAGGVLAQCGSGVTACHNLLAMEAAGLTGGMLYAGSWSEWCAQPGAPIATGPA